MRDAATRRRLAGVLPYELELRHPPEDAVAAVAAFARKTGDYRSLSVTDLKVLALAYTFEREMNGVAHLQIEPGRVTVREGTSKQAATPSRSGWAAPRSGETQTGAGALPAWGSWSSAADGGAGMGQGTGAVDLADSAAGSSKAAVAGAVTGGAADTAQVPGARDAAAVEARVGATDGPRCASVSPTGAAAATTRAAVADPEGAVAASVDASEGDGSDDDGMWITPDNVQEHQDYLRAQTGVGQVGCCACACSASCLAAHTSCRSLWTLGASRQTLPCKTC